MADLLTRKQVVDDVRMLLNDEQFSETTITFAANAYQNSLVTAHRFRFMEENDTMSGGPGDTTIELPDDFFAVLDFWLTVPQIYNLSQSYIEYGDFMRQYPNWQTAQPGQILQWTFFANAIRLARPLNVVHTLPIDYLRRPDNVVQDSDTFEIFTQYEEMFAKGTLVRCMEINEDYGEASTERANLVNLEAAFIKAEGRGGTKTGPTVIRTNRRRTGYGQHGLREW